MKGHFLNPWKGQWEQKRDALIIYSNYVGGPKQWCDESVLSMAQAHSNDTSAGLEHFLDSLVRHPLKVKFADEDGTNEILLRLLLRCIFFAS